MKKLLFLTILLSSILFLTMAKKPSVFAKSPSMCDEHCAPKPTKIVTDTPGKYITAPAKKTPGRKMPSKRKSK